MQRILGSKPQIKNKNNKKNSPHQKSQESVTISSTTVGSPEISIPVSDTATLVFQLEATTLIRQLKEANEYLQATANTIIMRTYALDAEYRQKVIHMNAYRARTEALQKQLQTEQRERKAQAKRNQKYATAKLRRGGMLATRRELLENRIKELELTLKKERELVQNTFLEREDELLNIIREKKDEFEKERLALVETNAELKETNQILLEQLQQSKRNIEDNEDIKKKRIKM